MATNQLSLNQIIQYFATIAATYKRVHSFGYGPLPDLAMDGAPVYPLMWVEPVTNTLRTDSLVLRHKIHFLDLVQKDLSNRQDVMSDTLRTAMEVKAYINKDFFYDIFPTDESEIEPVFYKHDDAVEGHVLELDLQVDWLANVCNIPGLYPSGATFTSGPGYYNVSQTGYLPLTGGILTGALSGTSAYFQNYFSAGTPLETIIYNIAAGSAYTANYYTTGATLVGTTAFFNRNDLLSAYTLDLSSISGGSSGNLWSASTGVNSIIANNGTGNLASGSYSIATGKINSATGNYSIVGNGYSNIASGEKSFIGNGGYAGYSNYGNLASGTFSFIGNGFKNQAQGYNSTILNGQGNTATTSASLILNGAYALASAAFATIINASQASKATGIFSFVGVGRGLHATGPYAGVIGGGQNQSTAYFSSILNGQGNRATSYYSTVINGSSNYSTNNSSLIGNGSGNFAYGYRTTVLNGTANSAATSYATVLNGQTNKASGSHSIVLNGANNIASGDYTIAEGANNIASGITAHVEGSGNTAGGAFSHTEGWENRNAAIAAHVEGYQNIITAAGIYGHAEGFSTTVLERASHAEGWNTQAGGPYGAHAEGLDTIANGQSAHAEGVSTQALGTGAHAEGSQTTAFNDFTHAQNRLTTAYGANSHAGGLSSIASGTTSFVHGTNSVAYGADTIVFGNGVSGTNQNTVYVPYLNIKNIYSGTPTINLGLDSIGNVVTGTTGAGIFLPLSGGTVSGATTFQSGLTSNVFYVAGYSTTIPGYSNTLDTNTGLMFDGPDVLSLHTGGVQRLLINAAGAITNGSHLAPTGIETYLSGDTKLDSLTATTLSSTTALFGSYSTSTYPITISNNTNRGIAFTSPGGSFEDRFNIFLGNGSGGYAGEELYFLSVNSNFHFKPDGRETLTLYTFNSSDAHAQITGQNNASSKYAFRVQNQSGGTIMQMRNDIRTEFTGDTYLANSFGKIYSAGTPLEQIFISSGSNVSQVSSTFDGIGGVITTGSTSYLTMAYPGTFTGWYVASPLSGSIIVDIWKSSAAIPTIANSIAGTELPNLNSQFINSDTNLTTWTGASFIEGDVIAFYVKECTGITKANIVLKLIK